MRSEYETFSNMHNLINCSDKENELYWTGQICHGKFVYKYFTVIVVRKEIPFNHSHVLCNPPTSDISSILGERAVVCTSDGQILFRDVKKAKLARRCDLYNMFDSPDNALRNVSIKWGAVWAGTSCEEGYARWLMDGHVQSFETAFAQPQSI